MFNLALEEKIKTEAAKHGFVKYIIQEDLVLLKGTPASGFIKSTPDNMNTNNLCIYFNPLIKFIGVGQIPVLRSLSITGSFENKVVDASLAAMDVEFTSQITVPTTQDIYFTRHTLPFMAASDGLAEIKLAFSPQNIGAVTGFMRRIQVIPL